METNYQELCELLTERVNREIVMNIKSRVLFENVAKKVLKVATRLVNADLQFSALRERIDFEDFYGNLNEANNKKFATVVSHNNGSRILLTHPDSHKVYSAFFVYDEEYCLPISLHLSQIADSVDFT